MSARRGVSDAGDQIYMRNTVPLASKNQILCQLDSPDFYDTVDVSYGKEKVENLSNLIAMLEDRSLDFS